jgi:hypothetical protein
MQRFSPVVPFAIRFVVLFGLLMAPWPGWNGFYGQGFRALGNEIFGRQDGPHVLYFEPYRQTQGLAAVDSRVVFANRDAVDGNGQLRALTLGLDTRSIGWVPTGLTLALIGATPIPWRRRGAALLGGLILVHAFIFFSVAVAVWNVSLEAAGVVLAPVGKAILDFLQDTLLTQLGASFSAPLLIWILVSFRRQDLALTLRGMERPSGRPEKNQRPARKPSTSPPK